MKAVVLGASLGGLLTFKEILQQLPDNLSFPIFAVNHLTPGFDPHWPADLNQQMNINVHWAKNNTTPLSGNVYFAPPDYHLQINQNNKMYLTKAKPIFKCRPAIDPLFESCSQVCGENTLAILLSGINNDGSLGLAHVRSENGTVIIQSPEEAKHSHMPQNAVNNKLSENILTIAEIIDAIKNF